jgi:hypothetical protein
LRIGCAPINNARSIYCNDSSDASATAKRQERLRRPKWITSGLCRNIMLTQRDEAGPERFADNRSGSS